MWHARAGGLRAARGRQEDALRSVGTRRACGPGWVGDFLESSGKYVGRRREVSRMVGEMLMQEASYSMACRELVRIPRVAH